MLNYEFYRMYKKKYPPVEKFSRRELWVIILISIGAVLIEPFVVYKKFRHIPFTRTYYLDQVKYFVLIILPFVLVYLWANWRESTKRSRGYYWMGKFEVIQKQKSFLSCYLLLTPGKENKLKVNRSFFNKVHEGDRIIIRRDALGNIERTTQVKDFAARLRRLSSRGIGPSGKMDK